MSSASLSFSIATSLDDIDILMHLCDFGHQGDLSTALPVAYNPYPPLYPPGMDTPSLDANAEWMAALEKIPLHNQPILPEARGFPQTVAIANEQSLCISSPEDPFHDLVLVNTSLPSPRIDDPRFTGRVEDTALALVFMSPLQNDAGIALMGGSLDKFSAETVLESSFPLLGTLLHSWVILFPKEALGISPPSTRSAFGSNRLSSGSPVTEAIYTPPDLPQQTTMAAKPALSNTPSSWDPSMTTREITTIHPFPCPPRSYTSTTSPLFSPPNPPLPPTDGFPPPLYILPDSVPLPRHYRHPPRPVICQKHFEPSPEDAPFLALMNHVRAHPKLREPAMLKRYFGRRNEGTCPNPEHPSRCFTILVGPLRDQCRAESVALRNIQKAVGLCWRCNTW